MKIYDKCQHIYKDVLSVILMKTVFLPSNFHVWSNLIVLIEWKLNKVDKNKILKAGQFHTCLIKGEDKLGLSGAKLSSAYASFLHTGGQLANLCCISLLSYTMLISVATG